MISRWFSFRVVAPANYDFAGIRRRRAVPRLGQTALRLRELPGIDARRKAASCRSEGVRRGGRERRSRRVTRRWEPFPADEASPTRPIGRSCFDAESAEVHRPQRSSCHPCQAEKRPDPPLPLRSRAAPAPQKKINPSSATCAPNTCRALGTRHARAMSNVPRCFGHNVSRESNSDKLEFARLAASATNEKSSLQWLLLSVCLIRTWMLIL